MLKLPDC